ncbi:MAG: hypothetical protein R3B54_07280 [Bdellovibrionota bacterium]
MARQKPTLKDHRDAQNSPEGTTYLVGEIYRMAIAQITEALAGYVASLEEQLSVSWKSMESQKLRNSEYFYTP